RDAAGSLDAHFQRYSSALNRGALRGATVLNYLSSHDDGSPYDPDRRDPLGAATRLLLSPGGAQIYYGDELARPLRVAGAEGDANLRSFMNWGDLEAGGTSAEVLEHWRKLGRFRRAHPAVGAGVHVTHRAKPYIWSRTLNMDGRTDRVLVGMDLGEGETRVPVFGVFEEGTEVVDGYSGAVARVHNGGVTLRTRSGLVLLADQ
ncbi:MAG TPA: hypothetical protein VFM14_02185, partial [Gemmatimonadales bacterium]|nr:hypothetical protein [Gemmatimonadales bacterium]